MKTTIAALSLLSVITFGASAAQQVSTEQAQTLQSVGTITVNQVASSPSSMRSELSQKADAQGATAYRVIEARQGDNWHATAELYK
ncbi:hypothetical protein CIG19_04540 [Enterobacterales bacterium CwR94]|nr:hypothetical protein CIG19_04540 [Enterobacterales bacterium CwR94]